jgi:hypothetical protein
VLFVPAVVFDLERDAALLVDRTAQVCRALSVATTC